MTVLRHMLSILLLPATVTILVPSLLYSGRAAWPAPIQIASTIAGVAALGVGLALFVSTVSMFARKGRGTLAPWDPPKRLVVAGVYRHVRNPMISGVLFVLLGEALVFRSTELLVWFLTFFAVNAVYIPAFEERGLERRFGDEYCEYKRNVPRWVPRLSPWNPGEA